MTRFTLRQMECFRAVATTGSISAAAERERLSRSALASAIDELERVLKTQLFNRHKSLGMRLTPAGEQLLDLAHGLLNDADDIESAMLGSQAVGGLTLGCFTSLGPTLVPRLHAHLQAHHPHLSVKVYTEPLDRLQQLLRTGEIELAVSYAIENEPDLQTLELYRQRMHAILPHDHPLAGEGPVSAASLAEEPLILLDVPPSPEFTRQYFVAEGLSPVISMRLTNFEVIRSLVARGFGYSLFMQRPAMDITYEGQPVAVRALEPPAQSEAVCCAWMKTRRLSSNARAAIEGLKAVSAPEHSPDPYQA